MNQQPQGLLQQQTNVRDRSTVENRLTGLLGRDSRYMRQAQASGERQAQSRGLLNSTMGVQAAEGARIQAALPIAQQDAQTYAQADFQDAAYRQQGGLQQQQSGFVIRQQDNQGGINSRLQSEQGVIQGRLQGQQGDINSRLQREQSGYVIGQQNNQGTINSRLQSEQGVIQGRLQGQQGDINSRLQTEQGRINAGLQRDQNGFVIQQQGNQGDINSRLQGEQGDINGRLQFENSQQQQDAARLNAGLNSQQAGRDQIAQIRINSQAQIAALYANPNIGPNRRQAGIQEIERNERNSTRAIEDANGIPPGDFTFTNARGEQQENFGDWDYNSPHPPPQGVNFGVEGRQYRWTWNGSRWVAGPV